MKKKLILYLFLLGQFVLQAEEKAKNSEDLVSLKGITTFKFFFIPDIPAKSLDSLNTFAIQSLKKLGLVVPKAFDIQNPTNGMNNPNSFFHSPSLIYKIEKVKDIRGNTLPISIASLELKDGATIEKTKNYIQADIWKKACFIQLDLKKNPDIAVRDTLSYLLNEFNEDLMKSDRADSKNIIFYFAQ